MEKASAVFRCGGQTGGADGTAYCGQRAFEDVAIARLDSARSLTEEQLDSLWSGRNQVRLYHSPEQAMEALLEKKRPEDEVYAAGSLYLAGQLKAYLEKRKQKQQL
ncbi:MAG: hypothetical protein ACLVLH_20230 [Eisenbergiella massiliensis]